MATSDANPQEVATEDRELVEQLAKLQNIHNQIHNLRGLLPERLLKPTKAALENPSRSSPAKLATNLRATAIQGSKDIRRFATDFRSEPMQQLWQKSNAGDFPQGRDAWTVDYETMAKSISQSPAPSATNANRDGGEKQPEVESVDDVVKRFQDTNTAIKVDRADSSSVLPLDTTVAGLKLRVIQEDTDGQQSYHVIQQPGDNTSQSMDVVNAIRSGGSHQNLGVLLSMLASYKDLRFRPCDKCQSIFDKNVTYPVVRQRKSATNKDDASIEWSALHRGCI